MFRLTKLMAMATGLSTMNTGHALAQVQKSTQGFNVARLANIKPLNEQDIVPSFS